jgi:hypothetical protein
MRLIGALVGLVSRLMSPFIDLVSWVPARVQFKLLAAFLAIAMLLIMVGAVGLEVLSGVHQRAEELVKLQPLRRDRARPCALAQARTHDGWRRYGDERTGQGLGLYGALAGRRPDLRCADRFGHAVKHGQSIAPTEC